MANKIEFPRGDGVHHQFCMQADAWSAGGRLFFAAKPVIDDDNTDAAAVINQNWDDTALLADQVIDGITYKTYDCYFPASATNNIASNGANNADYLGEFQWVPSVGDPVTFPANDPKLDCIVYFDVKRKVTT